MFFFEKKEIYVFLLISFAYVLFQHVNHYSSFFKMLEEETLNSVLPGVNTIEEGNLLVLVFICFQMPCVKCAIHISRS